MIYESSSSCVRLTVKSTCIGLVEPHHAVPRKDSFRYTPDASDSETRSARTLFYGAAMQPNTEKMENMFWKTVL